MSFVLSGVREELVAVFASVLLLQCVDIAMSNKVVFGREALATNVASKRRLASMSTKMLFQPFRASE